MDTLDRFKQKAQNCITMAQAQAELAAGRLADNPLLDDPKLVEASGLLKSALANLERARGYVEGTIENQFVNELAREIEAEDGPTRPATWGDVVHFVLGLSLPRVKRAWNLAMVVLTEEA